MPLIHQENCDFSSIDFQMLESSINNLGEKINKHIINGIRSDESYRKNRRRPFSSTSMNHASHADTPLRSRNSKIANNINVISKSHSTKRPLRSSKTPLKSSPPLIRVPPKRNGIIAKPATNFKVECEPSTSKVVVPKIINERPKKLSTQLGSKHLDLKDTFKYARPNVDAEYEDAADIETSVPPFSKHEIPAESDEEEDSSNAKKQKRKNATSGELYDLAPIRAMRVGFQNPTEKERFTLENTSKWFVRWTDAIQVENKKDVKNPKASNIYKSSFSKTFDKMATQRTFKLPTKRISSKAPVEEDANILTVNRVNSFAYKMDEIDVNWLDEENWRRMLEGDSPINIDEFTHVIDTFEVDCYIAISRMLLEQIASSRRFFDDPEHAACDICYVEECESEDNIVFCEGCQTVVHQCCYGLDELPSGSWLCDVCLTESESPSCLLCPLHNGAMKKASDSNGFVHIACALWIPEVTFDDAVHREVITISKVKNNRLTSVCEVCGVVNGACLYCSEKDCKATYHVTCAQRAGFMFRMNSDDEDVKFISYCRAHTLQKLPPNTAVINKYVRYSPMKTSKDLEKYFASYTDTKNQKLLEEYNSEIIERVFDYWKLKRLDKGGPLILPSDISASMVPIFKEIATKPNEIALRKEPRDTRMAADNMRTLMWMVTDREHRKLESLQASEGLVNSLLNGIVSERLDDAQIDSAVNLIRGLNFGPPSTDVIMQPEDDNVVKSPSSGTEAVNVSFSIENYIPKAKQSNIESITSYRPAIKDDSYWNEIEGLDFDSSDDNKSPPQEESSDHSEDEEDESDDAPIFVDKPGLNFNGKNSKKPTTSTTTIPNNKNITQSNQEIVALVYD